MWMDYFVFSTVSVSTVEEVVGGMSNGFHAWIIIHQIDFETNRQLTILKIF